MSTFSLEEDLKAPVYFYYQLENFYQNHRRYVKSRSFEQLRGEKNPNIDDCDPVKKNSDIPAVKSISGQVLDPNADANPCGLVAKSFFNDTYTLT